MKTFTATEISRLQPTGPNEYDWRKFDDKGTRIATGGDATWRADVLTVTGEAI